MPRRKKETIAEQTGQADAMSISEIGKGGGVEPVAESDFVKTAELESFMQEELEIMVHPDNDEGSLPVITVSCQGVNQNIVRNVPQKVKRKYVEILARTRTTGYDQKTPDMSNPENIQMEEKNSLTYTFSVLSDPSPVGREWLQAILAQQ